MEVLPIPRSSRAQQETFALDPLLEMDLCPKKAIHDSLKTSKNFLKVHDTHMYLEAK